MIRATCALLLALVTAGCAIAPTPDVAAFAQRGGANSFETSHRSFDSPQALVLPVVQDRQTEGPSCGAHALASAINYWRGAGTVAGSALYRANPPADPTGYTMAELITLARQNGLVASAVQLPQPALVSELEHGRPVLIPVRVPSIYVQQRSFPGGDLPGLDWLRRNVIAGAGHLQETGNLAMINHYVLVAGYQGDTFVVLEPVMGFRTIRFATLARYRAAFGDAALVLSGQGPRRA